MRATDDRSGECEQLMAKINEQGFESLTEDELSVFLVYASVPDDRTYKAISPSHSQESAELDDDRGIPRETISQLYRPNKLGEAWLKNSGELFSNLTSDIAQSEKRYPPKTWNTLKQGVYGRLGKYLLETGAPKYDKTIVFWYDENGTPTGHISLHGKYPEDDYSYTKLCAHAEKCGARFAAILYTLSSHSSADSDSFELPAQMCRITLDSLGVLPVFHFLAGHPRTIIYEHELLKSAKFK